MSKTKPRYDNYNPPLPKDYFDPNWQSAGRVHEWKNYINEELQDIWGGFTDQQKRAIARNAEEVASKEDWD